MAVSKPAINGVNNLDLARFSLAAMVFLSHAHDLSQAGQLSFLTRFISSTLAVQAFFVISGFLIFQSYDRSSSIKSYASKRIRRILPAYALVIIASAILLGFASSLSFRDYIAQSAVWRYVAANIVFVNFLCPELPGVFQDNPVRAVNGALWTLKIEAAFYVAVPICVWLFKHIGRTRTLVVIYLLSVLYAVGTTWLAAARHNAAFLELGRQLPGQMSYFVAGAAIYYNFDRFRANRALCAAAGVILFVCSALFLPFLLRPVSVALLVMSVAFGPHMGRFGKSGDFSYGIYIVHFPILQALIATGLPRYSLTAFLLVAVLAVLTAAILLWHLVEKRFLRRDSHYRLDQKPRTAPAG